MKAMCHTKIEIQWIIPKYESNVSYQNRNTMGHTKI